MRPSGHSLKHGGLRGHSIGEIYPFVIVGMGLEPTWHILMPDGVYYPFGFYDGRIAEETAKVMLDHWRMGGDLYEIRRAARKV